MTLFKLASVFTRLGSTSFGGSLLPLMEQEVVCRQKWLTPAQFTEGIVLAELVPGPVALKLAFYVGQSLRGIRGALTAVGCFCLPSLVLIAIGSFLLFHSNSSLDLSKLSSFLTPIVVGLLLSTAWRLGKRCLVKPSQWGITLLAFLAFRWGWSPFLILWSFGLLGLFWIRALRLRLWKNS